MEERAGQEGHIKAKNLSLMSSKDTDSASARAHLARCLDCLGDSNPVMRLRLALARRSSADDLSGDGCCVRCAQKAGRRTRLVLSRSRKTKKLFGRCATCGKEMIKVKVAKKRKEKKRLPPADGVGRMENLVKVSKQDGKAQTGKKRKKRAKKDENAGLRIPQEILNRHSAMPVKKRQMNRAGDRRLLAMLQKCGKDRKGESDDDLGKFLERA